MTYLKNTASLAKHLAYGALVGSSGAGTVMLLADLFGPPSSVISAPAAAILSAATAGLTKEVVASVVSLRARAQWRMELGRWLMEPYIGGKQEGPAPRPGPSPDLYQTQLANVAAVLAGSFSVAIPLSLWWSA